jgi:hypothetical protein
MKAVIEAPELQKVGVARFCAYPVLTGAKIRGLFSAQIIQLCETYQLFNRV